MNSPWKSVNRLTPFQKLFTMLINISSTWRWSWHTSTSTIQYTCTLTAVLVLLIILLLLWQENYVSVFQAELLVNDVFPQRIMALENLHQVIYQSINNPSSSVSVVVSPIVDYIHMLILTYYTELQISWVFAQYTL